MDRDENTLAAVRRLGLRVSRALMVACFVALAVFAVAGFVSQQQAAGRLAAEVAQRRQALDAVKREQAIYTAELAALNDPLRYSQYAMLVGRHTLLLSRPGETLVLVTWTSSDGKPISERPTDWKVILHAAGIPTA